MVDLKCFKEDCRYNKSCNCHAKGIDINNITTCSTFEHSQNPHKHEEDRIPQALVRHNTITRCNTCCLFNNDGKCTANGITIILENVKNCKFKQNLIKNAGKTLKNEHLPCCSTYLPK